MRQQRTPCSRIDGPTREQLRASLTGVTSYTLDTNSDLDPPTVENGFVTFTGTQNRDAVDEEAWVNLTWGDVSSWRMLYRKDGSGPANFDQDADGDLVFSNGSSFTVQDADADGTTNVDDPDENDPCNPNFPSASCADSDSDGYADNGTVTASQPVEPTPADDNDACSPDPLAVGGGDCDSDGTRNSGEADAAAAQDPCLPCPIRQRLYY